MKSSTHLHVTEASSANKTATAVLFAEEARETRSRKLLRSF